ncbi:MAG: ribonuclease HII [Bacteroidia bacterium]|nr:ribonuclease HII [Bacteroidia bacterium]
MADLHSFYKKGVTEAGCDEAGRGSLAGPVFAAAVILPKNFKYALINDSKKLSESDRYELREIIEKKALAFSVAMADNQEIDKINILKASILAMHRALDKLKTKPKHLIIDGNQFRNYKKIPHTCIVKGDGLYLSIAAASILAKTYRDDYMNKLHEEYPDYGWDENKGYATEKHRAAIKKHGITSYHRKSYKLLETQLSFNF